MQKVIDQIQKYSVSNFLEHIKNSKKPNIIWGAGWAASLVESYLQKNNINISDVVIDNNFIDYRHPKIENKKLLSPNDLASKYKDINLFAGFYTKNITSIFNEKQNILKELGVSVNPIILDIHLMMYPERMFSYADIYEKQEKFQSVYEKLEDDLSRKTMIAFINQRIKIQIGELAQLQIERQYFNSSLIKLRNDEIYVDCGAYDGDTVQDFLDELKKQTGHENYLKIFAFEPNRIVFDELFLRFTNHESITCLPYGVWDCKKNLKFLSTDYRSSRISDKGDTIIELNTMDSLLKGVKPTLIKLDIEGAELQALKGAQKLIKEANPRIAVCVYHKNNDLLTIPDFLLKLNPNYKLYLRAHEAKSGELVLYSIP